MEFLINIVPHSLHFSLISSFILLFIPKLLFLKLFYFPPHLTCDSPNSELQYLVNPVPKLADPGVHPRLVRLRASYPPGNYSRQQEPLVLPLDDHRPPGIALAGIEAAPAPTRADEDVRDVFDVTSRFVHGLAHGVVDDGHGDLLQHAGEGAVCKGDGY